MGIVLMHSASRAEVSFRAGDPPATTRRTDLPAAPRPAEENRPSEERDQEVPRQDHPCLGDLDAEEEDHGYGHGV